VAVLREKRAGVGCHSNCSSSIARTEPCQGVAVTDRQPEYHSATRTARYSSERLEGKHNIKTDNNLCV